MQALRGRTVKRAVQEPQRRAQLMREQLHYWVYQEQPAAMMWWPKMREPYFPLPHSLQAEARRPKGQG
ncbi:hypothetical protein ASG86_12770 [Arthrobacter sp. Soil764]|nr:hypothetical protein ASG86_12770 [Arthrobacter sp. Soil764]